MPDPSAYPAELHAEFAALLSRTRTMLEAAAGGAPDRIALIDQLHRLGGAAGLFGRAPLGEAAKALGEAIEAREAPLPGADYAALAALIAAS